MARVELRRVSKVYPGGVKALHEVDLEARDGEILVLLGPNGSGKTTLLRLIAGLERLSSGEVCIGGSVVNRLPPRQRGVGMIFQGCVLYPHLTARQNMTFGLDDSYGGWTAWIGNRLANLLGGAEATARSRAMRERVRHTAQLLGVEQLLDRFPRQLSGGECQRVALGRALVRQPAVFLLDEPWSNVDVRLRQQLRRELQSVRGQFSGAMILVTHDHVEALAIGDRVAVMEGGRVHQVGAPAEIRAAPRTRFVAEFVGSPPMNFVSGWMRQHGRIVEFESGNWRLEFGSREGVLLRDRPVWLGIRPDGVILTRKLGTDSLAAEGVTAPAEPNAVLRGQVVSCEELAGVNYAHVTPQGPSWLEPVVAPWVARANAEDHLRSGDEVWLRVDPDKALLFDQQAGSNISLGLEVKSK